MNKCHQCKGIGYVPTVKRRNKTQKVFLESYTCGKCEGTGRV